MQTVTETKKYFSTFAELLQATKEASHQLTAQEIINRRTMLADGWQNIAVSDESINQLAEDVADCLGGINRTKASVKCSILYGRPQHWGLSRIFFREHEGKILTSYCAGQDYTWETAQIRNAIK